MKPGKKYMHDKRGKKKMGKFIISNNLYLISCRNKENTFAYCTKITGYRVATETEKTALYLLGNNPGFYINTKGSIFTCDINDIVCNPVIVYHGSSIHKKIKL